MKGPIIGFAIGLGLLAGAYELEPFVSIYNGTLAIDMALWVIGAALCVVSVFIALIKLFFGP